MINTTPQLNTAASNNSEILLGNENNNTVQNVHGTEIENIPVVENSETGPASISLDQDCATDTNSCAPSETSNSDLFIKDSEESLTEIPPSTENSASTGNIIKNKGADPEPQDSSDRYGKFIEEVPNIYMTQVENLIASDPASNYSLAVKTIQDVTSNVECSWAVLGFAGHSIWEDTVPCSGGAFKTAKESGRLAAIGRFAFDCNKEKEIVKKKKLYDYVLRIEKLFAQPMMAFKKIEKDEKIIREKQTLLIKQLFLTQESLVRTAMETTDPSRALEIAYQRKVVEKNRYYTNKDFVREIVGLKLNKPKLNEPKPDEPRPDEPKPDEPKPDEPKPDERPRKDTEDSIPIRFEPGPGLPLRELIQAKVQRESKELNVSPQRLSKFVASIMYTVIAELKDIGLDE
ncbi:MAG: hypothetical protein WKF92_15210 [Pyrinomonadaceae bacterium]